jgi:hypothetical protein
LARPKKPSPATSVPEKTAAPVVRPAGQALRLPLAFIAALAAFVALPQIRSNTLLLTAFAGAVGVLVVWLVVLWMQARTTSRRLGIEISLRPQHYLQAIAHTSIFVYWGMYWDPIRDAAPLIVAQIVFAYAFDILLAWSRRDVYTLGFGPFPIIYSTNLFLRFRDDWFYLQFLMVAVGFLAKELIRWQRDGRQTHVFNPSSFPLALFSLALIVTGTTHITWGEDIASLLILPPHIYLFIFLVALPGQFMFRVTTMTLPAVLTTYLFSLAYLKITGSYYFFDSDVPIAVFLGMHLLFTDPSTSPKTESGRVLFGVLYGLSVVGLYALLGAFGAPTFYDKLLQVPLLNLMVRSIDAWARSRKLAWLDPGRIAASATPRMRSLGYVTLWIVAFSGMSAAKGLGDQHPGLTIPFWYQACANNSDKGCHNLAVLESDACRNGSGWACNELGILVATGRVDAAPADDLFQLSCRYGVAAGCQNAKLASERSQRFKQVDPGPQDYPLLLREGKGPLDVIPFQLYRRACDHGFKAGCGSLAGFYFQGDSVPPDKARAAALLADACEGGHAQSCSNLGLIYRQGDGMAKDNMKSIVYLKRACDLGLANACRVLTEQSGGGGF